MTTESVLKANEELMQQIGARADEIDRSRTFPRENMRELGKAGVLGLLIPTEFAGAGAGLDEMSKVLTTLSKACASTAMVTLMHYCGAGVIAAKGSEAVKQKFLPPLATGEQLATLAFSETGSGGHFYAPVSELRNNRINARKSFATSAGEADVYIVSTRKEGAAAATESNLYLVPKDASGLNVEGRFEGLGLTGNASAPMTLTDVAVDDEARLGPVGSGLITMDENVLPTFQIGVASVALGIADAAFETITERVGARKYEHAGGIALSSIPRVQFLVAEMAIELSAASAYLDQTIRKVLLGDPTAMIDVLSVKVRLSEACLNVTSRAMTLGGGWAFGRRGGLERNFRDAQAAAIMAPSSDVLKEFVGKTCLGLPLF